MADLLEIKIPPEMMSIPRRDDPGYAEYLAREKEKAPWTFPEGTDREMTCAKHWLPVAEKIAPTPKTVVIPVPHDLIFMLDGEKPLDIDEIMEQIARAGEELGYPVFLRTDYLSGKHSWNLCCGGLTDRTKIHEVVANLVNESALADQPLTMFLAREMLEVTPIFHAFRMGLPVSREFRFFVKEGEVYHIQPYWPEDALKNYVDDGLENWAEVLRKVSTLTPEEYAPLAEMTKRISLDENLRCKGWSVDWLCDAKGKWWLTDMAVDTVSYKWEPDFKVVQEAPEKRQKPASTKMRP